MAEAGHDYGTPREREPADPERIHLAAAIKAVFEMMEPSTQQRLNLEAKLVGELNGVG